MPQDFEFRLTWSGRKDTPELRAVVNYLSTFHLFTDSKAELINHDTYMILVKDKRISEPQTYWKIRENEVGLVSLSHYRTYTTTWEKINSAEGDFLNGWRACKKHNNL